MPHRASAHGGGEPRLINAEAGPFFLSLWTLPVPLSVGEANFIAALGQPTPRVAQGVVVLDADIQLLLTAPSGKVVSAVATHQRATNKLFYESYLELDEQGMWQAQVEVAKEGQTGTAAFEFFVEPATSQTNWMLIGGIAIVVIALGWMGLQSRTQTPTPPAPRESPVQSR